VEVRQVWEEAEVCRSSIDFIDNSPTKPQPFHPPKPSQNTHFYYILTSATQFNTFRRLFVVQFIVDQEEKQKFKEFASEESSEGGIGN
jgi:hypothetical protein